jgi:hypothetical protein
MQMVNCLKASFLFPIIQRRPDTLLSSMDMARITISVASLSR